jgi:hypothetical protein
MSNLIRAASFQPIWIQPQSAWVGHLPFADWLIREISPKLFVELGTHSGNSYFAFCQSVLSNLTDTKCFAVDTWSGDAHSGNYDDEIYAKVSTHESKHYSKFSRLMRMYFDDAISFFEDKSIDLLHIDGFHTYEAVRHDFTSWLPKLAPGAVVLFHDTNVRDKDFGVYKFWKELQKVYLNNIEFVHSNGLGVLQLNDAPDNKQLEWLKPNFFQKNDLVSYFAALGESQINYLQIEKLKFFLQSPHLGMKEKDEHIFHLQQVNGEVKLKISHLENVVLELNETIKMRDTKISNLENINYELICKLNLVFNSRSWKLTKPVRGVNRFIKTFLIGVIDKLRMLR